MKDCFGFLIWICITVLHFRSICILSFCLISKFYFLKKYIHELTGEKGVLRALKAPTDQSVESSQRLQLQQKNL